MLFDALFSEELSIYNNSFYHANPNVKLSKLPYN